MSKSALPDPSEVDAVLVHRIGELDASKETVVLCRSGKRSLEVARYLQGKGFRATNLAGGILAWSRDVDATIPTY
mgnify:CR=1 FL=1